MAIIWIQGPRIRSAAFDTERSTHAGNQRLLLQFNQPPGTVTKDHIRSTPAADFTVIASGNIVIIEFKQPLLSGTTYNIEIRISKRHTVQHTFRTAPAVFYYARHRDNLTTLYRQTTGTDQAEAVYTGCSIADYIAVGDSLAIVEQQGDHSRLFIYNIPARKSASVELPGDGTIAQLRAAPDANTIGFLYTDHKNHSTGNIVLYDLAAKQLRRVTISQSTPVEAANWALAKNGTTILARTFDGATLLLDPKKPPVPFGQYDQLFGFGDNDNSLFLRHDHGEVIQLEISTGKRQPLLQNNRSFMLGIIPFATDDRYLIHHQAIVAANSVQQLSTDSGPEKQIYTTRTGAYILDARLSANDQYLAFTEQSADSHASTSRIIETTTGSVRKTVSGTMIRWPAGR